MKFQTFITFAISFSLLFTPVAAYAETAPVNPGHTWQSFTYVSPSNAGKTAIDEAKRTGKLLMRVLFLGAISQGIHYFPEETDLLTCVMYVGGYNEDANLNGIQIRRKNEEDLIEVDLEDLIEDGEPVPLLKDGDIVTINWSWRKDLELYYTITGFLTSVTAFTLSVLALSK